MIPSPYIMPGINIKDLTDEQRQAIMKPANKITIEAVIKVTCEYYSVDIMDIFKKRGNATISWARHVICYIAWNIGKFADGVIAKAINHERSTCRDNRTVVGNEIQVDKKRAREVREIGGIVANLNYEP